MTSAQSESWAQTRSGSAAPPPATPAPLPAPPASAELAVPPAPPLSLIAGLSVPSCALPAATDWRRFLALQPDGCFVAECDGRPAGTTVACIFGQVGWIAMVLVDASFRGRGIATHAWGAGGSLMQNLHFAFAAPNTHILEVPPDYAGLHAEIMDGSFVMRDGYALPPDRPGLGIVLTDEIKNRYPFVPGSGEFNSVPGKILTD